MGTFISASDLSPFVTIETSKANAMIADAEAQATLIAPCISDLVVGTDDTKLAFVKAILRAAILRWEEGGAGGVSTVQQGGGPFQQMTVVNNRPRIGKFWPSEIEQLQGLCATNSGAFGLDTAPSQSGVHAPWCSLVFSATYCSCGSDIAGYPIYEMG